MGKGDAKAKKVGRKRKQGVARTENGRISRAKAVPFEESPQQVVLQARRRALRGPMPIDMAMRPVGKDEAVRLGKRGSVLGCMADDRHITAEMQAAGDDYCQRYMTYAALNGMPRPTPQGPAYGEVRGGSRPERLRAAQAAKDEHFADQRVLTHCSAGVRWAIKRACVLDEAAPPHLVREGLMALMKARG
ncbi:MAG: hypothetical protein ABJN39_09390 [Sulfitobacter sp.]|uniref:hypothetical protein n=1 Tax=Alphaproteobacteria TaxID=28211 RepID=UPI002942CBF1|nr:hypothetical protein [Sulfitobacter sp. LC.270.F.C4]WOI13517.1 hypothetical protein R1T45_01790 [Sulfitobacter sp. LC.270.F.C4]